MIIYPLFHLSEAESIKRADRIDFIDPVLYGLVPEIIPGEPFRGKTACNSAIISNIGNTVFPDNIKSVNVHMARAVVLTAVVEKMIGMTVGILIGRRICRNVPGAVHLVGKGKPYAVGVSATLPLLGEHGPEKLLGFIVHTCRKRRCQRDGYLCVEPGNTQYHQAYYFCYRTFHGSTGI